MGVLESFNDSSENKPFGSFTNRSKQVIKFAKKKSQYFKHSHLEPIHVLSGILQVKGCHACQILSQAGLSVETIDALMEQKIGKGTVDSEFVPYLSKDVKSLFTQAESISSKFEQAYVTPEHLTLALLDANNTLVDEVLSKITTKKDSIKSQITDAINEINETTTYVPGNTITHDFDNSDKPLRSDSSIKKVVTLKEKLALLKAHGNDLTEMARNNELDKVTGREKEIRQVILILMRRKKNNPLLKGGSGVGKTAIAEGIAQSIANKTVPEPLKDKHIISLDLPSMVAGTKYRGQFEEKMKSIIEAAKDPNIILFIDEIHVMVGAGSAEGAIDAGNIFKPSLAKGLRCIGATTDQEYKNIEKDPALARRFDVVQVNPPTIEETIKILKSLQPTLEEFHNCKYSDDAILIIPKLTERYMPHMNLPDKAVDIMDEAGALTRLQHCCGNTSIQELEQELISIKKQKLNAIEKQDYELAVSLREREINIQSQIHEISKGNASSKDKNSAINLITPHIIATVIANKTGIPHTSITSSETQKLEKLTEAVRQHIIGQDDAAKKTCQAIIRSRLGLRDPKRPAGSLLFLGPTGVGKTFLAKLIAEYVFDNPKALIRIDMSEYMEKFAISRILGSPPGYVGHDETNTIADKVRRMPYAVILFDEIEKAHPDVLDILLQILEEGSLTDSSGRAVDFTHSVVILTSNIGSRMFANSNLGFGDNKKISNSEKEHERIVTQVIDQAAKVLRPELINRFDATIVFKQLNEDNLRFITDIEINKVKGMLKEQFDKNLHVTNNVLKFIIEKGFEPKYGARSIRRVIQDNITTALSEFIIKSTKSKKKNLIADFIDGKVVVDFQKNAGSGNVKAGAVSGDSGDGDTSSVKK